MAGIFADNVSNLPSIEDVIRASTPTPAPATGDHGFVMGALGSGFYSGLGQVGGAVRAAGTAVGAPGVAQAGQEFEQAQQANAQGYARPDIDALPWYSPKKLAFNVLQGVPQFATMAAGALGAGALVGAAPEVAAGGAAAEGLGALLTRQGVAKLAGAGAAAYPFQVGANVERADAEGQPVDQSAAAKALALGVPEAALQGVLPALGETFLAGKAAIKGFGTTTLRKAATGAAVGAGVQVPVQAATEGLMQQMGDPDRPLAQRAQDVVNAALGGAMQGAVVGGFTHLFAKANPNQIRTGDLQAGIDQALSDSRPAANTAQLQLPAPGTPGTEPGLPPPQRFVQPPEPLPGEQPLSGEAAVPPAQPGQAIRGLPAPEGPPRPISGEPVITPAPDVAPPTPRPPLALPEPTLEGTRPVSGQPVITPPPEITPDETSDQYKQKLTQFDNNTLLHHAQMQGPDSVSGKAALEVLADRLKWQKGADLQGQLDEQDAAAKQQALADSHRQQIKDATKGSVPSYLKNLLGDEDGIRKAIFDKATALDQEGTPLSGALTRLAQKFNVMDEKGALVDPTQEVKGATNLGPETEPAPEQANPVPPRVLKDPNWSQGRQDLWEKAEGIRSNLPDTLNQFHQDLSDLQSKIAKPGKGGLGAIRTRLQEITEAVEGQKAVDKANGVQAEAPPEKPVVTAEETQGATKFDTPPETPPTAPVADVAPERPSTEPQSGEPTKPLPELDQAFPPKPGETFQQGALRQARNVNVRNNQKEADNYGASDAARKFVASFVHPGEGEPGFNSKVKPGEELPHPKVGVEPPAQSGEGSLEPSGIEDHHSSKPTTQLDRDLAYITSRPGMGARDALRFLVQNGSTSVRRTIAARLLQMSTAKPFMRWGTQAEAIRDHKTLAQVFGDYHSGLDRIRLYDTADLEHTMIHEFTHAATMKGLNTDPVLKANMDKLLKAAHEQITPDERKQYGFKNSKEMVAEAFSNPHFAQFLDGLKPPKDMGYSLPGASIWRSFKELVRRTFGFPKNAETMLDHVMHLAGQTIDATNAALNKATSARGMDETMGLHARGLIEEGERVVDALDRHLDPKSWGNRIFKATLGGRDAGGIADTMHNALPSAKDYKDLSTRHAVLMDRLNAVGNVVANMRRKLDKAAQKNISYLKTFTNLNIDPRLDKFDKHTWLQDVSNKAALEQNWRKARNAYLEAKRTGADKVYEAENNANRMHLFAAFTGMIREVAGLKHPELELGGDPFNQYTFSNKLHSDPRGSADFFHQSLTDHLGVIQKFISDERAAAALETDPEKAQARLENLKALSSVERGAAQSLAASRQAPNFALRRRGNYMVSGTLGKANQVANIAEFQKRLQAKGFNNVVMQPNADNNVVYIRTETQDQMERLHQVFLQAQTDGLMEPGKTINKGSASSTYKASGASTRWLNELITSAKDKFDESLRSVTDPKQIEAMRSAHEQAVNNMYEQYMDLLPESSMSKIFATREGVQGFDGDMNHAFDERTANSARAIANISMRNEFGATMKAMRDQMDGLKRDNNASPGTTIRAQSALDELQLRELQRGWKTEKNAFDGVRHLTHMFELGFSVPYMVTLMSQVPTLGWSELAKQHGYVGAAKAMAKHTPMAFKIMKAAFSGDDKWHFTLTDEKLAAAGVPKDIADFIMHQNNRGDFNLSSYTQRIYENQHDTIIPKIVHDVSGASTLYAEMAPRLITALAAKDLYEGKPVTGKDFNDLHSFVSQKVERSQFSWNPSTNPRFTGRQGVLGTASPLVTQFMGYHLKLLEKLYRETADAFGTRGEEYQSQGKRFMLAHLGAMTALSGTMGLPMVSWFAGLYDRLADWATGDNTHDLRASYRDFLNTTFGKDVGEVLAHGAPRAAGIDLSHLGEDRILLGTQLMTEKRQWEDAEKDWLKSMAGSAFGLGSDIVLAGRDMYNGDYLEAASKGMPEFFRNIADSAMVAKHGYTDKSGFQLPIKAGTSDALMKLLGFDPEQQAEYKEEHQTQQGLQARTQYDQQNIMRHLALAFNRQDPEGYQTWLQSSQEFMQNHPGMPPPAAGFGDYLRTHARSAALAGALGTPVGVKPRDFLTRGMVSFGNIGNQ